MDSTLQLLTYWRSTPNPSHSVRSYHFVAFALLGCYAAYFGNCILPFRDRLLVTSLRFKRSRRIRCPIMSVKNQLKMLNIPAKRRPQLHCGGSLYVVPRSVSPFWRRVSSPFPAVHEQEMVMNQTPAVTVESYKCIIIFKKMEKILYVRNTTVFMKLTF